jgi:hypothetical protein
MQMFGKRIDRRQKIRLCGPDKTVKKDGACRRAGVVQEEVSCTRRGRCEDWADVFGWQDLVIPSSPRPAP